MKVYVVYEMLYGELLQESGDSADIIGIFTDKEKALEKIEKVYIDSDVNDGYVLDEQCKGMISEKYGCWRLFWEHQENWNCYYEIVLEEKEVK